MVCNPRFHRRTEAQRLVNPAEVVVHVVRGNRVPVIVDLLGKRIGQAREAAHVHSHC